MYLLVSVVVGIGIHLDERLFEVHVVTAVLPTFLWRVREQMSWWDYMITHLANYSG